MGGWHGCVCACVCVRVGGWADNTQHTHMRTQWLPHGGADKLVLKSLTHQYTLTQALKMQSKYSKQNTQNCVHALIHVHMSVWTHVPINFHVPIIFNDLLLDLHEICRVNIN